MSNTTVPNSTPSLMNVYKRLPVAFVRGQGVYVWDTEGRQYLDALAGIGVNTLGHAHPRIVKTISEQAAQLIHCGNYYQILEQEKLADELVALSQLTNVFFCSSGLEANEACIKLARKHGHDRGLDYAEIVVFEGAFHGRSLATLSASANEAIQKGFSPLVPGFVRVPRNDLKAIESLNPKFITAVFFETIQGEGGINFMEMDFLLGLRALCHKNNWLLMVDEVQCGMGRTGKWLAHQWAQIKPDVVSMAKGLASGLPIGAVIAGKAACDIFQPGNHGCTFGGSPLVTRVALETIEVVKNEELLSNAGQVGAYLKSQLQASLKEFPQVVEIRGQGLMLGIELDRPCSQIMQLALAEGLLLSVTAQKVVRLLPPLIMTQAQATEVVEKLYKVFLKFINTLEGDA